MIIQTQVKFRLYGMVRWANPIIPGFESPNTRAVFVPRRFSRVLPRDATANALETTTTKKRRLGRGWITI